MAEGIYAPSGYDYTYARNMFGRKLLKTTPVVGISLNGDPEGEFSASISSTGGNLTVVSGIEGKSIVVDSYVVVSSGATSVKFLSNSTDLTGSMQVAANGGISANSAGGMIRTASGEALVLNSTSVVAGHISYRLV